LIDIAEIKTVEGIKAHGEGPEAPLKGGGSQSEV
jgi:hypothetical protein